MLLALPPICFQWSFQEREDGFLCDIESELSGPRLKRRQTEGPAQASNEPPDTTGESLKNEGGELKGEEEPIRNEEGPLKDEEGALQTAESSPKPEERWTGIASSASHKKTAQQKAALKLLQQRFPQLLQLVKEGPWNSESSGTAKSEQEGGCAEVNIDPDLVSAATFNKAAAALRATTPSNTLNNLCLVSRQSDKNTGRVFVAGYCCLCLCLFFVFVCFLPSFLLVDLLSSLFGAACPAVY